MVVNGTEGIKFDSQLELDYYEHLSSNQEVVRFTYHPAQIAYLVGKRSYTPDFIVEYADRIEVVETKGYNPYSKRIDDAIHEAMKLKSYEWLAAYVKANGYDVQDKDVVYKKLKHLQKFGFVDWDFKNPNTLANQRKVKLELQGTKLKELERFKAEAIRYLGYMLKMQKNVKLTKPQREWLEKYEAKMLKEINDGK